MSQSTPTKHDGRAVLFAVAELLVTNRECGAVMLPVASACVSICARAHVCNVLTFESPDLETSFYLAQFHTSRSSDQGQGHRSKKRVSDCPVRFRMPYSVTFIFGVQNVHLSNYRPIWRHK